MSGKLQGIQFTVYKFRKSEDVSLRLHIFNKLYDYGLYNYNGVLRNVWYNKGYDGFTPEEEHMAIAWDSNTPIGVAYLPKREFYGWEQDVRIDGDVFGCISFFVESEHRRMGIGRSLGDTLFGSFVPKHIVADHRAKSCVRDRGIEITWIP